MDAGVLLRVTIKPNSVSPVLSFQLLDFLFSAIGSIAPHAQRGLMRLLQHRAEDAQQDFDRCLELNPKLRQSLERMIAEAKQ